MKRFALVSVPFVQGVHSFHSLIYQQVVDVETFLTCLCILLIVACCNVDLVLWKLELIRTLCDVTSVQVLFHCSAAEM